MINIFSLYKTHHEKQRNRLNIYQKVLKKIHRKIKLISNYGKTETYYVIEEFQFSVPLYNQIACICYLIINLRKNGFDIIYTHPNFLWISWSRYINKFKYNIEPDIENKNYKYDDDKKKMLNIKTHYKNLNDKLITSHDTSPSPYFTKIGSEASGDKMEPRSHLWDRDQHNNILSRLNHRAHIIKKFDHSS